MSAASSSRLGRKTRGDPTRPTAQIAALAAHGTPDPDHISTSCVERANLTMRMSMRRFTRLTSGFSKKAENHAHAVAIHFMYDNFGRYHQTLRSTPAMRAGVTDHRMVPRGNRAAGKLRRNQASWRCLVAVGLLGCAVGPAPEARARCA